MYVYISICIYVCISRISRIIVRLVIIISYVMVLVQIPSNRRKSKIKTESYQACVI